MDFILSLYAHNIYLPLMLPVKCCFIWSKGFRGEDFSEIDQPETRISYWWPCFLTDLDKMSSLYRGPSMDVSYQVSVNLAYRFQRRRCFEIDQPETRIERNLKS